MRKMRRGRKFGRERNQRRALLKSLASSFFMAGRLKTTEAKAKELRPYVEKFITRVKNPTLANRRILLRFFSGAIVDKVIKYGDEMRERDGGYTRIIKLGARKRDGARMAYIEFVQH